MMRKYNAKPQRICIFFWIVYLILWLRCLVVLCQVVLRVMALTRNECIFFEFRKIRNVKKFGKRQYGVLIMPWNPGEQCARNISDEIKSCGNMNGRVIGVVSTIKCIYLYWNYFESKRFPANISDTSWTVVPCARCTLWCRYKWDCTLRFSRRWDYCSIPKTCSESK